MIEIVTGFVQSNILHSGLFAPDDSLYLAIKPNVERIKYEGNKNGMPSEAYAKSIVDKILVRRPKIEIWEGGLSWILGFIVNYCPLWFVVCPNSPASLGISRAFLQVR